LSSRKKQRVWKEHPFLTEKGIQLIKQYTPPRTDIGMGRFASYKEYGEKFWRVGYGSQQVFGRAVSMHDKLYTNEIEEQLEKDLEIFSDQVQQYVYVPLNRNRKGAVLSFAHSLGIIGFKNSRLLELINSHASKREIIKEWSPYINKYWLSGGDLMRDRRRTELNTYFAADAKIPSFVRHDCHTSICLLNLPETYTGAPSQVKAVEYLEKKIKEWDPSGHVIRRFYRLWSTPPRGLGNQERPGRDPLDDQ